VSIRDSLIKAAIKTGVAAEMAHQAHRGTVRRLSPQEKWTVRIAVAEATLALSRGEDCDPCEQVEASLKIAREHVAKHRHLLRRDQ
jgi:hypothetical protein